jgi:hypothetical protein
LLLLLLSPDDETRNKMMELGKASASKVMKVLLCALLCSPSLTPGTVQSLNPKEKERERVEVGVREREGVGE